MNRLLGVAVLCAALTACTAEIPGPPPKPVPTTSPRIDKPRNLVAVDPCKLVVENDYKSRGFGTFAVTPAPYEKIPGSCAAVVGSGKPDDLVVVVGVAERSYDEEKANNPKGHQGLIDGHHVWFSCGGPPREITCAAWAPVAYNRTLSVGLVQVGASESRLLLTVQAVITAVLERLPAAS
ncbi:hypothetical protein [Lentzea sp. NPDC055074]